MSSVILLSLLRHFYRLLLCLTDTLKFNNSEYCVFLSLFEKFKQLRNILNPWEGGARELL